MLNQKLVNNIKGQLQEGVSQDQLRKKLASSGWRQQDIEEGFNMIGLQSNLKKIAGYNNAVRDFLVSFFATLFFVYIILFILSIFKLESANIFIELICIIFFLIILILSIILFFKKATKAVIGGMIYSILFLLLLIYLMYSFIHTPFL